MALRIHFRSGLLADRSVDFGDDVERVRFGRDPEHCEVVFPADEMNVSREHCALRRVLGRYRLILNGENSVFIDGRVAHEDQILEDVCEVRLGDDGPVLTIETTGRNNLAETRVIKKVPSAGRHTIREQIRRSVRFNWLLTVGIGLLVLSLGYVAYRQLDRQHRDLESATREIESAKTNIVKLSERERANVASLVKRIEDDPIKRARKIIAGASPSVFLVMKHLKDGSLTATGTAWVAGKATLATNAHVAEAYDNLKPGERLLVRSNDVTPVDHEIRRVTIHPGFGTFMQAVSNHRPLDPTGAPASFIPACDVALMHTDGTQPLGSPLKIAAPGKILQLQAGDRVCFLGYPLEGVRLSDFARPQPTSQIGHITSLTDVFAAKALPEKRYLVLHNLPVTGGVSGSPLLDMAGEVVAIVSAGSFHVMRDSRTGRVRRIPIAVGVNFAQRADLLRELLENRQAEAQRERDTEWGSELTRFKSGRLTTDALVEKMKRYFVAQLAARGVRLTNITKTLERAGTVERAGVDHGVVYRVDITAPGHYLIVAVAEEVKDLDVVVLVGTNVVDKDLMHDHYPSVIQQFSGGDRVRILVHLKKIRSPKTGFKLFLFRGEL